jgi:hypothetical protein
MTEKLGSADAPALGPPEKAEMPTGPPGCHRHPPKCPPARPVAIAIRAARTVARTLPAYPATMRRNRCGL